MAVESPFRFWDPPDEVAHTLYPARYEEGASSFVPAGRAQKSVPVLRIWMRRDPPAPPPLDYWDFSGARLRARLLPLLPAVIARGGAITLIRRGQGIDTDYEVRL